MRTSTVLVALLLAGLALGGLARADATVGKPAPGFQVSDTRGRKVDLASLKGKFVVLEWWNHQCPFVQGQYDSGKMQAQQKAWTSRGVVWITVCSSAPGKQGHVAASEANRLMAEKKGKPTHVVLDPSGTLGRLYGARTTPHMFVLDSQGRLVYNGAIDDRGDTNYVQAALTEAMAGRPVSRPVTRAYGCAVKYDH